MAKLHGRNASIYLDLANTSTSTAFTCDSNSMSLSWTREAPEVTTFCDNVVTRLADGVSDWELSVDGYINAPNGTASNAWDLMIGDGATRVIFGLGGSATGCPMFTACAVMTEFSSENSVDGATTYSMSLTGRSGSMTASTW
jgi:hypothetical protein